MTVDGIYAGQIWIHRGESQYRLVDISLLKAYQNNGIGTFLIQELIDEARRAGLTLACSVATNNPRSLRFHQRLGFRVTSQNEMYYQLERLPEPALPA